MDFDRFFKCAFVEGLHSGGVNLGLGGELWVPHLDEEGSQVDVILSVDVGGTYFGLSR